MSVHNHGARPKLPRKITAEQSVCGRLLLEVEVKDDKKNYPHSLCV